VKIAIMVRAEVQAPTIEDAHSILALVLSGVAPTIRAAAAGHGCGITLEVAGPRRDSDEPTEDELEEILEELQSAIDSAQDSAMAAAHAARLMRGRKTAAS